MIDFDKPMRVKRDKAPLSPVTWPCAVMHDNGVSLLVHGETGKIYKFALTNDVAENVPPEPRRRYQPIFAEPEYICPWLDTKCTTRLNVTAWLIETDHGEGASPRWTYEREEVNRG